MLAIDALFTLRGSAALGPYIMQIGIWGCFLEFSLGNILCLLWQRRHTKNHTAPIAWITCVSILVCGNLLRLPETALVPAVFAALILALTVDHGWVSRLLAGNLVRYLGEPVARKKR
jgi:peptidoglycan/LPS O-acetylase OafA/YrhL